jgi:Ca-activated chloride channel family protein
MSEPIKFTHAWNKPYVSTNGLEKAYLLLEMKGTADVKEDRAPLNLSLVLDRSGSMHGSPIQYSKQACQFVVGQMSAVDLLSMVAFDNQISTVFDPEKVTHKDLMKSKINTIEPGGTTNLSAGLIKGAQYVLSHKKSGVVQRVILLSDGHANEGITDEKQLAKIAQEYKTAGVGITTMGVGEGFDEELMETIADNGGGNFYYIDQPDQIPQIFAQELKGLLKVVAQNVQLKLKPSPFIQITDIYGYNVTQEDGNTLFSLGDIYSEEIKSILIEVSLEAQPEGIQPVIEVEWNYVDVTDGVKDCSLIYSISIEYSTNIDLIQNNNNNHVEKQVHITQSAQNIEQAMKAFDDGDYETGQTLMKENASKLAVMADSLNDNELKEESNMLFSQMENFEYSQSKRKELHQQKYRQMKRRKPYDKL